jgi:hypothetical protein
MSMAGVDKDRAHVELVENIEGTDAGELLTGYTRLPQVRRVVIDPRSPASTLLDPLRRRASRKLVEPQANDITTATGELIDRFRAKTINAAPQPALEVAVHDAMTKDLAAGAVFDRRLPHGAEILAVTLALWAANRLPRAPRRPFRLIYPDEAA